MVWNSEDKQYMERCLELALKAHGDTSPNPLVGAVIVKNGTIIGQGYHRFAGAPHAEIEAFQNATTDPAGATLYVNLEPCCVHGRTPPCTRAIIQNRIKKIVVATLDPNPDVSGQGMQILRNAGCETEIGLLAEEARKLNETYLKFVQTSLPFVILKSACSLDGKIATASGKSQWITSLEARTDGHLLRRGVDAVLVGIDTVLADNPDLRVRHVPPPRRQPCRIVLDTHLRIPLNAKLVTTSSQNRGSRSAQTIVVASQKAPRYKVDLLQKYKVQCLLLPVDDGGRLSLKKLFTHLAQLEITSILIEGGPTIAARAFQEDVVDKVVCYMAPIIIGGQTAPGSVGGGGVDSPDEAFQLHDMQIQHRGSDLRIEAYLHRNS
ncbi:bifunctional diaminohydroxyphosphoribosylaminopyrimidine deaminase/5-amino-6-(5-phosphoribosylamino)uracil reductase RibD [candidate division CSSED10-310 bacterium]|uniref:Riboflavin biosynthesis protein RibD n=1 Tax=candidate division CSSED10-310 bacterium TaxID=2855610 RepID=A0ABV6Z1K0_UNCC1